MREAGPCGPAPLPSVTHHRMWAELMVGDPRTATQGTAAAGNGQGNAAQVTPLLGFAASVDPYWAADWTGTVVSSPHNDPDTGLPRPPTSKIPHYGHTGIANPTRPPIRSSDGRS